MTLDSTSVTLRKGWPGDASSLADIFAAGLKGSPWWNFYYRPAVGSPTPALETKIAHEVRSLRRVAFREALCNSSTYTTLAIVDGQIAAFAMWSAPSGAIELQRPLTVFERVISAYTTFRRWMLSKLPRRLYNWLIVPTLGEEYRQRWSASGRANNAFFSENVTQQDRVRGYWFLSTLTVRPEYQRLGIGRKLIQEGLARVDQSGLNAYTAASGEGKGLYEKMGFKTLAMRDEGDVEAGSWTTELMCYAPHSDVI